MRCIQVPTQAIGVSAFTYRSSTWGSRVVHWHSPVEYRCCAYPVQDRGSFARDATRRCSPMSSVRLQQTSKNQDASQKGSWEASGSCDTLRAPATLSSSRKALTPAILPPVRWRFRVCGLHCCRSMVVWPLFGALVRVKPLHALHTTTPCAGWGSGIDRLQ